MVVYICQFLIGIVANISVIVVLAISPQKSTSTYHVLHLGWFKLIIKSRIYRYTKTVTLLSVLEQINLYWTSKAVADSLLLFTLPFNADSRLVLLAFIPTDASKTSSFLISRIHNRQWRFGSFLCKANESMKMINFFHSILMIGIAQNYGHFMTIPIGLSGITQMASRFRI